MARETSKAIVRHEKNILTRPVCGKNWGILLLKLLNFIFLSDGRAHKRHGAQGKLPRFPLSLEGLCGPLFFRSWMFWLQLFCGPSFSALQIQCPMFMTAHKSISTCYAIQCESENFIAPQHTGILKFIFFLHIFSR